jgi:tripartite ATP-independent transporter DctM subunit
MVLYGALVDVSISRLFMAGLLPKLLLAGLFMVYIAVMIARKPSLAPKDADHISSSASDALHVLPLVLVIAAVLGGIYTGLTTVTEAAAIGVAGALIVAAVYGRLKVEVLNESILAAIKLTSMVMTIVMGAQILSAAVVYSGLGREVAGWLVGLGLSRWTFFLGLIILYIILGCFVDGISMVYMTLPVLMPSIKQYGFDLMWMGIVLAILIELGQIHPPVGVNLITIHAIAKGKFSDVVIGSFPYVFIMLFMLLLLAIWPGLALWLPSVLAD